MVYKLDGFELSILKLEIPAWNCTREGRVRVEQLPALLQIYDVFISADIFTV
jgi:hypothetical protein